MNEILRTLGLYSVKDAIIILIVVILTSLIKIPVKRAASKYAENGGNKSVINFLIVFICLALSFFGALALKLIELNWDWSAIPWCEKVSDVLPQWGIIFAGASTIYAIVWESAEKGVSAIFKLILEKLFKKDEEKSDEVKMVDESPVQVEQPKPKLKAKDRSPEQEEVQVAKKDRSLF